MNRHESGDWSRDRIEGCKIGNEGELEAEGNTVQEGDKVPNLTNM